MDIAIFSKMINLAVYDFVFYTWGKYYVDKSGEDIHELKLPRLCHESVRASRLQKLLEVDPLGIEPPLAYSPPST